MDKNMGLKTTEKELKEAFACFDKDGNGFITAEELREAMQKMGDKYSKEDIEEMIKGVDIDCDGQVSYEGGEFWSLWYILTLKDISMYCHLFI